MASSVDPSFARFFGREIARHAFFFASDEQKRARQEAMLQEEIEKRKREREKHWIHVWYIWKSIIVLCLKVFSILFWTCLFVWLGLSAFVAFLFYVDQFSRLAKDMCQYVAVPVHLRVCTDEQRHATMIIAWAGWMADLLNAMDDGKFCRIFMAGHAALFISH